MATATIGSMQEFQPGSDPITAYLKTLQACLDANDVAKGKRTSLLVSTNGYKTYGVLHCMEPHST